MARLGGLRVGPAKEVREMAVYVDDYRVRWRGRWWSHLIADSPEELHAFAARLGRFQLRFHHKPGRPWKDHYDMPEGKRGEALALGAKPITARQAAQMLRARRLALRDATRVGAASTIGAVSGPETTGGVPARPTREELAARASRSWSDARSLLFVCLGNVCRSPFAERLALDRTGGRRRATSAGHYPYAGRRSPELALAAAEGFGVDLASHRSRVLSRSMIDESDAVFVFDDDNHRAVLAQHAGAAERTHMLGALNQDGPLRIADPFGGPPSLYQAVYRQIADAIEAVERGGP